MFSKFLRVLFFVREYLFPSGCALCGENLLDLHECWYGLCRSCLAGCRVPAGPRCGRCGRPLVSEKERCLGCREKEDWDCGKILSLFPYTGKYRRLLAAYKFGKSRGLGHFFAARILEFTASLPPGEREKWETAVWVPVPPRRGKIKASGWDQTEYLAGILERPRGGKNSGTPAGRGLSVLRCLKRLASPAQKKLGLKDRRTNLLGRIIRVKAPPPEAVILDDLITTGSTLEACAAALREGGAGTVRGFCLFYT